MVATKSALPAFVPSDDMLMNPPGIPPGEFAIFADAISIPCARKVSAPVGDIPHACNCEFSPHAKIIRPCVGLMYCTGVECICRVLPQGRKLSVVGSCGHGSTGPGDAVSQTGGLTSFAQFALALAKSEGIVFPIFFAF